MCGHMWGHVWRKRIGAPLYCNKIDKEGVRKKGGCLIIHVMGRYVIGMTG